MCGICRVINTEFKDDYVGHVEVMTESLKHRGPDSNGFWISDNKKVVLTQDGLYLLIQRNR